MPFPPHNSPPAQAHPSTAGPETSEYSRPERATLLKLAHASIEAAVEGREFQLEAPSAHLAEPRWIDVINVAGTLRLGTNQKRFAQHLQMLGDG